MSTKIWKESESLGEAEGRRQRSEVRGQRSEDAIEIDARQEQKVNPQIAQITQIGI